MDKLSGIIIGLEGNIGAGKTTFGQGFKLLSDSKNVPCTLLSETAHVACLKLFIENEEEYGSLFQVYMLSDCQNRIERALDHRQRGEVVVVDRTPWGNTVFEHVGHSIKKIISDTHHEFYKVVSKRQSLYGVDYILYFDLDPEMCIQRKNIRGNEDEKRYQIQYFNQLDNVYVHRVIDTYISGECPIIVIPPLSLDLREQIIDVLNRVLKGDLVLPRVSIVVDNGPKINTVDDLKQVWISRYKNRIPYPYTTTTTTTNSNEDLSINYQLYHAEPNLFKRCVMSCLASFCNVYIYNYNPSVV